MDRVPYRRKTPPRHKSAPMGEYSGYNENDERDETISYGENLILQCIISAVILVVVLVAGMTDIAPSAAIRDGISQVLSGPETFHELVVDVRSFGAEWLGWEDAATVEPLTDIAAPAYDYYELDSTPGFDDYPDTDLSSDIDEYSNYYENYPADEASNPAVPEPSVTPGLWD